jgi:hypothetical protein
MTPGNNPEAVIHNNNHGESLQSHNTKMYFSTVHLKVTFPKYKFNFNVTALLIEI